MTNPRFPDDPAQPKPVRLLTWAAGFILLVAGGLPLFGVPISSAQLGFGTLVLGAMLVPAGILLERQVTPTSSPRADDGTPLVRADRTV